MDNNSAITVLHDGTIARSNERVFTQDSGGVSAQSIATGSTNGEKEHIKGNTDLNSNFVINENGRVGGNATVNGSVTINANAKGTIIGNADINGNLVVREHGTLKLKGNADVNGNVYLNGSWTIKGIVMINGNIYLNGSGVIKGNHGYVFDQQGQRVNYEMGQKIVVDNGRVIQQPSTSGDSSSRGALRNTGNTTGQNVVVTNGKKIYYEAGQTVVFKNGCVIINGRVVN